MRTTAPLLVTCLVCVACQASVSASAGGGATAANDPPTPSTPSTSSGSGGTTTTTTTPTTTSTGTPTTGTPSTAGTGTATGTTTATVPSATTYGAVAVRPNVGTAAPDPDPPANAHAIAIAVADGKPAGMQPGAAEGYWVWRDGSGWHLRTTTKAKLHKFQGWIGADSFSDITASKLEVADKVRVQNKMIQFDFSTAGHEDGLDFKAAPDDCVRFHLRVDDKPEPSLINLGASAGHPPKAHFKLCPDGKMGVAATAIKPGGGPKDDKQINPKKDDKKDDRKKP